MTLQDGERKIGINISVPYKYISLIDKKANNLKVKRSNYIWCLIKSDLGIVDERN